jgi:hypothetical protein
MMMSVFKKSRFPNNHRQKKVRSGHRWFTPVIPATQEAEIRRIEVRSQPGQIDPILKKTHHKKGLVEQPLELKV